MSAMEVTLLTFDECTCRIPPEVAAKSEFIQGAIEDATATKIVLKLSHQSCTLHTIQRIVNLLTRYLNKPGKAGFDDSVQMIAIQNFVGLCDEEVLDIIIASDVLDIQAMRELLGKRPETLHIASRFDSPHAIRALLEGKSSIEARDIDSRTPLHCAAALGNVESLSALLEASAVVNVHDRFQQSPLHLAASSGWIAVVEKLISASARPDTTDWCRQTPMHLAAVAGRDSVLRTLIRCRANIDAEDGIGQTPLHLCAASGKTTSARMLVEQGV
jgi:ankyrin repeat protein